MVGDAHLADVVERSRLIQHFDRVFLQRVAESRLLPGFGGEELHVVLRAPDVRAGFVVAGLGQGPEGHHGHVLDHVHLPGPADHLLFEVFALVLEEVPGGFEVEVGLDPGHDQRGADGFGDVVHRPPGRGPPSRPARRTEPSEEITGMSAVIGSSLSRRQTSKPSMPSMITSSRMRSGLGRPARGLEADLPEVATRHRYGPLSRLWSSATFSGTSSTMRMVGPASWETLMKSTS